MNLVRGAFRIFGLVPVSLLAACGPILSTTPTPVPRPSLWQGAVPIGDLLAHPDAYLGRVVVVVAYYRGWDLFGEVGAGPPLTRSDVAVADASGAIYIAPAGPESLARMPPVLPFKPEFTETLLRLRGRLERNEQGMLYLRVLDGEEVQGLPTGVVLRVRRTGGIAGFDEELMATESGTLYFLDRRARRHGRTFGDPNEILGVARRLPSLSEPTYGTPVPDGFAYEVRFWEGDKVRGLTIYDPSGDGLPEAAGEILEAIRRWLSMAAR
ncbi:hypothetical protein [Thermoflexus sp.]|uniref:hypothetical protein n=1 Tax=Thermoflexus sp. TaxID=1969742 RepID=UPI0035E4554D